MDDVYKNYRHKLHWQKSLYFTSKTDMDAFPIETFFKKFPIKINCIEANEMETPIPARNNNYGIVQNFKVKYEAVFA
jgi:hypothetical protein